MLLIQFNFDFFKSEHKNYKNYPAHELNSNLKNLIKIVRLNIIFDSFCSDNGCAEQAQCQKYGENNQNTPD